MPKLKKHHLWRWASLATVIILLALSLSLLGSLVAAAQGSSTPSASDSFEIIKGNKPPLSYPWELSTVTTRDVRSTQADEFDLAVDTWNMPGYARPGGVFVYGIFYQNHPEATVDAANVVVTATLPAGTAYMGDTSGLPHSDGPGGEVSLPESTWLTCQTESADPQKRLPIRHAERLELCQLFKERAANFRRRQVELVFVGADENRGLP